ncbi:hypothetical protein [Leptolyngbya sp. NIES-2104]|nr:hypothetical protein [Leptolyngbya sp. NIES-2104]GAP98525.1 hypothetical protein NIES2104_50800 [Leptolyngbya sp. NIES-2104]
MTQTKSRLTHIKEYLPEKVGIVLQLEAQQDTEVGELRNLLRKD